MKSVKFPSPFGEVKLERSANSSEAGSVWVSIPFRGSEVGKVTFVSRSGVNQKFPSPFGEVKLESTHGSGRSGVRRHSFHPLSGK